MKNGKNDSKKDIRWYTYVNEDLDKKLTNHLKKFGIKSRAKYIRKTIEHSLDYLDIVYQNHHDDKDCNLDEIHDHIKKALMVHLQFPSLYKELKQSLSPLKTSLLLLEEIERTSAMPAQHINNAKTAIKSMEKIIERHYEQEKPQRLINTFDLLHIEDNELERKTIGSYFRMKDIEIISLETAEEAIDLLKNATPKVILLDLELKTSQMNGVRLCKYIKSNRAFREIPIIIITALSKKKEREELKMKLGVKEVILKPINSLADLDIVIDYIQ